MSRDDEIHVGGYHGTDNLSAARISERGFADYGGDVYFAPLDNLMFAQKHGQRRAENSGDNTYHVVQAFFPGKKLEFGMGGDQIRIPRDELERIGVVALLQFDMQGQLLKRLDTRK